MLRDKINIITLGCSKNVVDSEKLIKQLEANGYDVCYNSDDKMADIVIVNTCGFINDAKEESINTILQFVAAKESNKIKQLYVTGCLSERYADELRKEIPEVDKYFGVNSMKGVLEQLNATLKNELLDQRVISGPGHYAYLKISEGCDRSCAFCAIPKIRGKSISQPIEKLVKEAMLLADAGVKELILVAQDLSYYGLDLYKKQMLPVLLQELVNLNRFEWIRLHYLYPSNFPWELVGVINNSPNVCKYIDIPIQHITDNMLLTMRRSHDRKETEEILNRIRAEIPGAVIRTTLITGYPGETENDFIELCDFIKGFRFDRLGVFPYSHEEGTWAYAHYDDNVTQEIKNERVSTIMEIQERISSQLNEARVNTVMKTLIDRREGDFFVGRTQYDSPEVDQEVLVPACYKLNISDFYNIRITETREFDLFGEPV